MFIKTTSEAQMVLFGHFVFCLLYVPGANTDNRKTKNHIHNSYVESTFVGMAFSMVLWLG